MSPEESAQLTLTLWLMVAAVPVGLGLAFLMVRTEWFDRTVDKIADRLVTWIFR